MKMIYKIHPITKFNHTSFVESKTSRGSNSKIQSIHLSPQFWQFLFSPKNLLKSFLKLKWEGSHTAFHQFFLKNFSYLLGSMESVKKIFQGFSHQPPKPEEVIFGYRIMNELIKLHNVFEKNWKIDLAQWVTFSSMNFNSDNPDISLIESIIEEGEIHSPYRFIKSILEAEDIHNSIVIIDFFWPGELLQILMICSILKKNGNTIIIDATHGNEQFDFTKWVEAFSQNPHVFDYFDYFLVYQDYGVAMNALLEKLSNGWDPSDSDIQNIIHRNSENQTQFIPPSRNPDENELYENFTRYYLSEQNITPIAGTPSIVLRLLPYKCYWSACNFCAINSTHLYSFRAEKDEQTRKYVDQCVQFLKKNNIVHVVFMDEAIHPGVIEYFADVLIAEWMHILYQFRARFELAYTQDFCDKLYQSWARYCGIGLESAIDRLEQTINKWLGSISVQKKQEIIHYFNNSGIALHNYAIFGFPTETKEESLMNARFLIQNIKTLHHYTCTPNVLSLMRGTNYFTQAKRFGIEVIQEGTSDFSLNYNFQVNGIPRNFNFYHQIAQKVHITQFLSWFQPGSIDAFHFWTFIDRTALFYLMKRLYRENPYFTYWRQNIAIIPLGLEKIKEQYFQVALGNQWMDEDEKGNIQLYNWVSDRSIIVPTFFKDFLSTYNSEISLEANMNTLSKENKDIFSKFVFQLLETRIFLY